jgi:protein KRI1
MKDLLSSSDSEDYSISVNKTYAKKFQHNKEREERQRLEEKLKDKLNGGDSDTEPEDDYAEELTPAVDAQILKTIALIRTKDPSVYNPEKKFFEGNLSDMYLYTNRY